MLQPIDYDRIASEYARNRQVHPLVLSRLLSGGQVGEASRVLEVSCGTGNYARAFSALHLIAPEAYERGLARLEEDLRRGPVECVSRYALVWGKR